MNRRSLITQAALSASAVALMAGEAESQTGKAKPSVDVRAVKQAWKYKLVPVNQSDLDQAGREMWEAVGLIESNIILFKQPA
jgi:hypothetical protein